MQMTQTICLNVTADVRAHVQGRVLAGARIHAQAVVNKDAAVVQMVATVAVQVIVMALVRRVAMELVHTDAAIHVRTIAVAVAAKIVALVIAQMDVVALV